MVFNATINTISIFQLPYYHDHGGPFVWYDVIG